VALSPPVGSRMLLADLIGRGASSAARLLCYLVERVGVVSAKEVQGKDSNNDDQHDHGHKDNQDRSDHHTIPLTWPRGGASQTRAATYASLPRSTSALDYLRLIA
jgi:hypothetical protein